MEFGGKEIKYDERGERESDAVTPSGLRQDDDGYLVIDEDAAARAALAELIKLRTTLRIDVSTAVDLWYVRQVALDYATRGTGGSMTEERLTERFKHFVGLLTTGDA